MEANLARFADGDFSTEIAVDRDRSSERANRALARALGNRYLWEDHNREKVVVLPTLNKREVSPQAMDDSI